MANQVNCDSKTSPLSVKAREREIQERKLLLFCNPPGPGSTWSSEKGKEAFGLKRKSRSMASFSGLPDGLKLLLLSNGLEAVDFVAVIENLKNESKNVGTHKRLYAFLKYSVHEGEGHVEIVELTKRQKGLVTGSCDIVGVKKHRPDADGDKKAASGGGRSSWCAVWSEDDAQSAWEDLTRAEPCIYLTNDGVFVCTKYKKAQCKAYGASPLKSLKDLEKAVADVGPTLRSISFTGNDPPSVLPYNLIVCGAPSAVNAALPATLGSCDNSSSIEVYSKFVERRCAHMLEEAGKMIGQMHTDMARNLQPIIYASSMKDAGTARKNSLMKKVFVHESKTKFIDGVKADNEVEMFVISGDIDESKDFYKYGGIVFELFYRADLSVFG
eukprot:GSChrysophyteH1.ASY1.ANO1.328.1 assembled CDS